jgi:hypothetical protein
MHDIPIFPVLINPGRRAEYAGGILYSENANLKNVLVLIMLKNYVLEFRYKVTFIYQTFRVSS